MNLKELMLNYLREEGFCPKEEEYGLAFKCEGLNFIFFYDEDDDQYFRLMILRHLRCNRGEFPCSLARNEQSEFGDEGGKGLYSSPRCCMDWF